MMIPLVVVVRKINTVKKKKEQHILMTPNRIY